MINPIVQKIIQQFKKASLSVEDRTALITTIQNKLMVLPLDDTIIVDARGITVNGNILEPEQVINLRESCMALKDNYARKLFVEQIKFLAINIGIHNSTALDTLFFAKAALWTIQQEEKLIEKLCTD